MHRFDSCLYYGVWWSCLFESDNCDLNGSGIKATVYSRNYLYDVLAQLPRRPVEVLVVGCGGNGSAIAGGLPYLLQAMLAQGHPHGLHVTVMDGDVISPFNCIRQPYTKSEIGLNKAIVLVNRINLFWGLEWAAIPKALTRETLHPAYARYNEPRLRPDIVIGCVDTRAGSFRDRSDHPGPARIPQWRSCLRPGARHVPFGREW